jgi:hypothetical protein
MPFRFYMFERRDNADRNAAQLLQLLVNSA